MKSPKYYLNENFFIKLIEFPALYNINTDELYCLDERALKILTDLETNPDNSSQYSIPDLFKCYQFGRL